MVHRRKRNATYTAAVRLMIVWNLIITSLIVGGSAWRLVDYRLCPLAIIPAWVCTDAAVGCVR